MALNLLKRSEVGSPLTAVQHDANFTLIETSVNQALPVVQTAAEWTADVTTILLNGQLGLESDTNKVKYGNGTDLWSALLYFAADIDPDAITEVLVSGDFSTATDVDNVTALSLNDFDGEAATDTLTGKVVDILGTTATASVDVRLPEPTDDYLGRALLISVHPDQSGDLVVAGPLEDLVTASVTFTSSVSSANIDTRYMRAGDPIAHSEVSGSPTIVSIDVVSETIGQITISETEDTSNAAELTVTTRWADFVEASGDRSVTIRGTVDGEQPVIVGFIPRAIPASGPPIWRITERDVSRGLVIGSYGEKPGTAITQSDTSALVLDADAYQVVEVTLEDDAASLSITATTGYLQTLTVRVIMDGTGGHTWPAISGEKYVGGTAPTIDDAANAENLFIYFLWPDGDVWAVDAGMGWST